MICFRFSLLSVTGQFRMEFYRRCGNAQSWFQFSSAADLIQQIHSILDRLLNVSFISKIIKKIAACQLTVYLETNKLLPECQSGFRRGHSTETLLLHLLLIFMGL